jgi:hypothetical protein
MRFKLSIGERLLLAGTVGVLTVLATVAGASASTNSQWKLGSYTANGGFSFKEAKDGNFSFPVAPNPALDLTNKGTLVGDQLGKTITANFIITDPGNTFTYGGEPDGSGGVANMRLYFDSASIVGTQVNSNYWWSDTEIQAMTNGTFTLTAVIDPTTQWSDYDGKASSSTNPADCPASTSCTAAFDAAASDIKDIGLSFGGGYFAANGVGTPDGLGTFTLKSLTVS